ncbi:MAG: hypothetical protein HY534_02475 [Chloroflexi bacterium]|nr:hypothetical protein [Chloroflexota bacterium]
MGRINFAILLPLSVLPLVVAVAIFIGWTLHQFSKEGAVVVALLLTLGITAAGFIADRVSSEAD